MSMFESGRRAGLNRDEMRQLYARPKQYAWGEWRGTLADGIHYREVYRKTKEKFGVILPYQVVYRWRAEFLKFPHHPSVRLDFRSHVGFTEDAKSKLQVASKGAYD